MRTNQPGNMATSDRHSEQNQGGSTRRTESPETDIQQNHQASFKSEINRTNPESEQYTDEFINSIYQSLTGTQTTKTKGKQKVRRFKSRKTTITNLSSFNLSEAERNLLGRGLNFIPTPTREHPAIILQDYLLFDQKLRLQYYFMDKEKNTTNDKPTTLKQSTGWTPPNSQDQNFDSYRNLTQRDILKELDISPSYRRFNLPKSERQAIKTLANNDKITIKAVDKGGKIVIQDTTDYISECERQLENTVHYKRLYTDPTAELNLIIKNKLEQGIKDGHISTEEFEVLYNRDPRTSNFYTLPKIHKTNNPG